MKYSEVRTNISKNIEKQYYGNKDFYIKEDIKDTQCIKCIKRGSIKYCRLDIDQEKRRCRNYKGV